MDFAAETQLAEMLRKFPSRSKTKSTLVLATMRAYAVVCRFVGNCLTLLVMLLNGVRAVPNLLVASLAVSDLLQVKDFSVYQCLFLFQHWRITIGRLTIQPANFKVT